MITRVAKGITPILLAPNDKLICYQHGDIVVLDEGVEKSRIRVLNSFRERVIGKCDIFNRLLRLGIRASVALDNNNIIFSIGNILYELNIEKKEMSEGYYCGEGIRPLIFTKVEGITGISDGIYFGGYLGNFEKRPVNIYKRCSKDKWEVVYTFEQGSINHVHNIVPDPYRECLWIFTGDYDDSAAIWRVTNGFKKVERVACNDQKFRGCVAFALPEGLLYATDAPFADDYIYLMNPQTLEVKELFPIDGSCIYGCQWKDNYVFSSTVEGDGRNTPKIEFLFGRKRGAGIKDSFVHMYCGNLKDGFREIYKEKKDGMPYYTFQFGVFKFPYGINNSDVLYFQPVATKVNDQHLMAYSE